MPEKTRHTSTPTRDEAVPTGWKLVPEAGGERKVAFFKDGKVEDAIAALAKPASSPAGRAETGFDEWWGRQVGVSDWPLEGPEEQAKIWAQKAWRAARGET